MERGERGEREGNRRERKGGREMGRKEKRYQLP